MFFLEALEWMDIWQQSAHQAATGQLDSPGLLVTAWDQADTDCGASPGPHLGTRVSHC